MTKRLAQLLVVGAALSAGFLLQGGIGEAPPPPARPVGEFLLLPVRVHLLRMPSNPAVGTDLRQTDVTRIFRKLNAIWHPAGIHFWVESVTEEPPAGAGRLREVPSLQTDQLLDLRRRATLAVGMFHLYFIGSMRGGSLPINGLCLGPDAVFVQQHARLLPAPGGVDEPLPRVAAHELGHTLDLLHERDPSLLMAQGTTGARLPGADIETARSAAMGSGIARTVAAFRTEADTLASEGHIDEARRRLEVLAELPGRVLSEP